MKPRKPISKTEATLIKKQLNFVLANFDNFNRHQLRHKLEMIAKFCDPREQ